MKKTSQSPIKVSEVTRERVRIAAAVAGRTQAEIIDSAVDEYLARHADEFTIGLKRAREALFAGTGAAVAYLLDEDEEAVRRVSGV